MNFKQYLKHKVEESTQDVHNAIGVESGNKLLSTAPAAGVKEKHDEVFGKGVHHKEIALSGELPEKVKDHVSKNGGALDPSGHKVTLKSGRIVDTSKFLGKSNAPKDVSDEYQNHVRHDKGSTTKLVISRHPGEVASASTNTHWHSCADLHSVGPAKNKLPNEIKHGTMIAMHLHKDAKPNKDGEYDAKDVLGRTLIKRHDANNGKTTYHPEGHTYGSFPKEAMEKTHDFVDKHYNNHDFFSTTKHSSLYNDDGENDKVNKNLTDAAISKALEHKDENIRETAISHPNATPEHISKALNDEDFGIREAAIKHPNATSENISKALDDKHECVRRRAISHPNATPEHISKALDDEARIVRREAIKHPKVTHEHINKALDDKDKDVRLNAISHPNATHEHISKALNDEDLLIRSRAIKHPKVTHEHISKALNDEDLLIRSRAIKHPKVTHEHISKALDDKSEVVRQEANDRKSGKLTESTKDIKRLADHNVYHRILAQKPLADVRKWHEKAFGFENHKEMDLPAEVPPKVVDHVSKHGGNIDDSGHKVTLKSGRVVDTSKFLGKSNAPKDVNDEYQHHLRNASQSGNTKLVISKHPGEVASCSTGTSWSSCANAEDGKEGQATPHLPDEIKHGTMIAMHLHKDAKPNSDGEYDAKDVLGRRLIKRHDTDNGKIVYHQEEKSYGQFPKSAIKKVEEFTSKHNTNDHVVAIKHDSLYDDDGKTAKLASTATPDNIHKALDHNNETVRVAAAGHPNASEDNIKKAINDESHEVVKSALTNKSAPDSLLRHTINHTRFANIAALAASNDNLSKGGILDALKHEKHYVGYDAINPNNPNFDSECLEKAINQPSGSRLLDKGFEDRLKPEHIDKFLDNKGHIAAAAANHKNASSENLHKALSHENRFVRRAAIENNNASKEHLDKAMNDEDFKVRGAVLNHPKVAESHIIKGLKDKHEDVVHVAKAVAEQRKIK